MKRILYLLMSCLLLCSTAVYAKVDTGPSWEPCKVFNLGLDNTVAHVSPSHPQLDTGLTFDRIDPGTSASQLVTVSPERLHYRLIEPGSKSLS